MNNHAATLAAALRACSAEIRRLHYVHGERYADKIGEPELEAADVADVALAAYDAEPPLLDEIKRGVDTRAVAAGLFPADFLAHHAGPVRLTDFGEKSTIVAGPRATIIAETIGHARPRIANARRMVACWNLCEGISTEYLESIPTMGGWRASLSSALKRIGNR